MSIFDIISLFGGLAMFLYGMRVMGDGLKEGSSGTLKTALEKMTNTPVRAFLLGLVMTAVIQSSTATIVITSGLVGAGILSFHQSLGIIIGANVGTTVTGQIIRLLDIDSSGASILKFFTPSTLAPVALIIGVIVTMKGKDKESGTFGQIAIGFGILFTGLLNMTDAVSSLTEGGFIERLFTSMGKNPILGYLIGLAVAFVLQSSSATIGILQAFSTSGLLTFSAIYAVLVGVYLGDCVTTALVCNIGAKPDARRVGVFNILYNLSKSAAILIAVTVIHKIGLLDSIWDSTINSGGIANTNTIFNLMCAIFLFPTVPLYEKLSYRFVKDEKKDDEGHDETVDALSPVFFSTPAFALSRCFDALVAMYDLACTNIQHAFEVIVDYNEETAAEIVENEIHVDSMADKISSYILQLSIHVTAPNHVASLNQYLSVVSEFERLSDHAMNIAETAKSLQEDKVSFSDQAIAEIKVLIQLLDKILDYARQAFQYMNTEAARQIEPMEEVVDDMINAMKADHLVRLRTGVCTMTAGTEFLNMLTDMERISDVCSNIGVATIAKAYPEIKDQIHDYVSKLHAGSDTEYNKRYHQAHEKYFALLQQTRG